MDSDWDWNWNKRGNYFIGGERNELWRIWWAICTTRIKRKTK